MFFHIDHLEFIARNWQGLFNSSNKTIDRTKYAFALIGPCLFSYLALSVEFSLALTSKLLLSKEKKFQVIAHPVKLHHLTVREVTTEDFENLKVEVLYWKYKAKNRQVVEPKAKRIFFDSSMMNKYISNKLASLAFSYRFFSPNFKKSERVFTCIGPFSSGKIQSIAIVQYISVVFNRCCPQCFLHINFIATNPNNIDHKSNPNRVKGAGTAMIYRIAKVCLDEGYAQGILLNSFKSAKSFYLNLGFEEKCFIFGKRFFLRKEGLRKNMFDWKIKLEKYQDFSISTQNKEGLNGRHT